MRRVAFSSLMLLDSPSIGILPFSGRPCPASNAPVADEDVAWGAA